jgi:hypothetical protein
MVLLVSIPASESSPLQVLGIHWELLVLPVGVSPLIPQAQQIRVMVTALVPHLVVGSDQRNRRIWVELSVEFQ